MAESSMSIKRLIFVVFNSIFCVLGFAVFCVGIYSRVEDGKWDELISGDALLQAANILIAAGVLVALIGFLGCFGALRKNKHSLLAYAILVFLIFILEIAAGIYAYNQKDVVEKQLASGVNHSVKVSYGTSNTAGKALTKAVDWFQKHVKCCGSASPSDWKTSSWFKGLAENNTVVPSSCCVKVTAGCNVAEDAKSLGNKIFTEGCIHQGKKFALDNIRVVGGVGIGIAVVELLGIVCAILLWKEFHEYEEIKV